MKVSLAFTIFLLTADPSFIYGNDIKIKNTNKNSSSSRSQQQHSSNIVVDTQIPALEKEPEVYRNLRSGAKLRDGGIAMLNKITDASRENVKEKAVAALKAADKKVDYLPSRETLHRPLLSDISIGPDRKNKDTTTTGGSTMADQAADGGGDERYYATYYLEEYPVVAVVAAATAVAGSAAAGAVVGAGVTALAAAAGFTSVASFLLWRGQQGFVTPSPTSAAPTVSRAPTSSPTTSSPPTPV